LELCENPQFVRGILPRFDPSFATRVALIGSHGAELEPNHRFSPTPLTVASPSFPALKSSGIQLHPELPICQTDLPLDWYQPEFKPYAEEYLALPDRLPATVLPWMDGYIEPARKLLGPDLVLLAHYYMGGEVVKLVERYGGLIADSYQLAREAVLHPQKRIFVESAVHFMAEAIALLAAPHQQVWITNPKSGCTMEMMAKEFGPLGEGIRRR